MSPHINYYHSDRGDSKDTRGFGLDIKIIESILDLLDDSEKRGLCNGVSKMTWDFADTFWTIPLQKQYQPEVLERIQKRCKEGKDEVLVCSWSNSCQSMFNMEEMHKHTEWTFRNSLGLGMEDLFPGRVAPYMRPQGAMFTQGMIEPLRQGGVEGLLIYYSAGPFENSRVFLNPRLDLHQRYGLVDFKSTESEESILMIPTYGFIDILDHYSIQKWFKHIRHYQRKGYIDGHALVVVNFDMDSYVWKGTKLSRFLQWLPNTRGIPELLEAVDKYKYVELANLMDIVPKLKPRGKVLLRPDVADGNFDGYHNWAQKYNSNRMWTLNQQARWMKSAADTIVEAGKKDEILKNKIDEQIRGTNLKAEAYLKNIMLFSSTTNWGMSMPFIHPDRQKTAMIYGTRMFDAAKQALHIAIKNLQNNKLGKGSEICIIPILKRGITEKENTPIQSPLLIQFEVPFTEKENPYPVLQITNKHYEMHFVKNEVESSNVIESILPSKVFETQNMIFGKLTQKKPLKKGTGKKIIPKTLEATRNILKNKFVTVNLDILGKITSILYGKDQYFSGSCIETAVTYGKGDGKRFESSRNAVYVLKDGSDGFSASIRMIGAFQIAENAIVRTEKILTLYRGIPYLFVNCRVNFPKTHGSVTTERRIYGVDKQFDNKWLEVMPLEIEPSILGHSFIDPLRIWKHNFMGVTNSFDLNMAQIDRRNTDMDCLVSNISDGWMAVTNQEHGLVIGFDSLKCSNFAFSPIKVKEKGFGNTERRGQQIRLCPFGTYWGKQLHYWSDPRASGYRQEIAEQFGGKFSTSAPSYNGKQMDFNLVFAPYKGDAPPKPIQAFMNHYSLPPVILGNDEEGKFYSNCEWIEKNKDKLVDEFGVRDFLNMTHMEWIECVNKEQKVEFEERNQIKLKPKTALRLVIHGLRGL